MEIGPCGASLLARELGFPRQSIYSILQKMLDQGLIEQTAYKSNKIFIADPNQILNFIDNTTKTLNKTKSELEELIPKMHEKHNSKSIPKVRYYDQKTGVRRLLENILEQYSKSNIKEFRGYGINRFKGVVDDFLYEFVKKRFSYGVETKLLIAKEDDDFEITDESNRYGRTIKRMNIKEQEAGLYLVGDRIYLFSYKNNMGMVIEDEAIAKLLTDVFDSHWKLIK